MKLHAPKNVTFWISVILAAVGVLGHFVNLGVLSGWSWLLILAGFILLMLGVLVKGL